METTSLNHRVNPRTNGQFASTTNNKTTHASQEVANELLNILSEETGFTIKEILSKKGKNIPISVAAVLLYERFPWLESTLPQLLLCNKSKISSSIQKHKDQLSKKGYQVLFNKTKMRLEERIPQPDLKMSLGKIPIVSNEGEDDKKTSIKVLARQPEMILPDTLARNLIIIMEKKFEIENLEIKIKGRSRKRIFVDLRQLFSYIMKYVYGKKVSYGKIGSYIGRDHASVLRYIDIHPELMKKNKKYKDKFNTIEKELLSGNAIAFMKSDFSFFEVLEILKNNGIMNVMPIDIEFMKMLIARLRFTLEEIIHFCEKYGVKDIIIRNS